MVHDLEVLQFNKPIKGGAGCLFAIGQQAFPLDLGNEQHVIEEIQLPFVCHLVFNDGDNCITDELPGCRKNGLHSVREYARRDQGVTVRSEGILGGEIIKRRERREK